MALDKDGNTYVAGHSTRTNAPYDFDYVVIKYSPVGVPEWANRYGLPGTNDEVRAMVVGTNGDVFVTGTTDTIKYFSSGLLAWSAPYAGRDMVADTNGNAYVTGFLSEDFSIVKLNPSGSNMWLRTWDLIGSRDVSQRIAIDRWGNTFIGGLAIWYCDRNGCSAAPYVIKYDADGNQMWVNIYNQARYHFFTEIKKLACDDEGTLYSAGNFQAQCCTWTINTIKPSGEWGWGKALYSKVFGEGVMAMALDSDGNVYTTGGLDAIYGISVFLQSGKLSSDGASLWEAAYLGLAPGYHRANAIAADSAGNAYVSGQSTGLGTGNDYVTIKYATNGQQLWVKRYTEAGNSDDQAHAIAVSPNGDVYVTGFSNPSPGTYEITTIKYIQVAPIEKKSNGNILLSFCGAPGSNYVIEACTTLTNWTAIGTTTASPTGVYTFEDTNAPSFCQRFYRTKQE